MVTEYEWDIITEAMSEYQSVCEWSHSESALPQIRKVNNRLGKAVDEFEKLKTIKDSELKKLGE